MNENDPTAVARSRDAAAWSRYWAAGALHSCPEAFSGNYGAEIRTLWVEFFSAQPAGARVLDIGTGNGAIAFIARDVAAENGSPMEIEAIDAADIQPMRAAKAHGLKLAGVTFKSKVAAEATGYPDCWFDAVAGHYALEYTRTELTVRELARIVKPGAELLFVMHHADSSALVSVRNELDNFDFIDHEVPLIAHAHRFLKRLSAATNPRDLRRLATDSEAKQQARELDRMVTQVTTRARSRPNAAFLAAIASQVTASIKELRSVGPSAALGRLNVLAEEMQGHRDRLRAVARASLSATDVARLTNEFRRAGLLTDAPAELKLHGKDLVGWTLHARREA